MVCKSRLWLALCASLLWICACDDSSKCGGESKCGIAGDGDGDGHAPGDGDGSGDGDGDGSGDGGGDFLPDGGCVYCGDAGPDGSIIHLPMGSVGGYVFTAENPPVPLKNVRVVGPENRSTVTNGEGFFVIEELAPGNGVVRAESSAHTHALRSITVREDASVYVELFLKPVYKTTFALDKGGVAKDKNSGATVVFPANSLKRADGSAAKGGAHVSVVAVNEGKAKAGTAKGTNSGGTSGSLKGYAHVEVRVEDDDGQRLQISNDKEADVEFPLGTKAANAPSQMAMWSMDEKDGTWKQEGSATKTVNAEGKPVYKGKIKHMSWWATGELVTSLTCVRGCVRQGDAATAGASVEINAVATPFSSVLSTDEQGCFYVDLEPSTKFHVAASNAFGTSSMLTFTSDDALKTVAVDKTACTDIGTLQLVAPPADAPRCPAGYELCGGTCVDVRNDSEQCGTSCENLVACTESGPSRSICLDGACRCPPGFTQCGTQCLDLKNDPQQCGSSCYDYDACDGSEGLTCVNGVCAELVCVGGTTPSYEWQGDTQYPIAICVDTQNDVMNCGEALHRCEPYLEGEPSPYYTCTEGTCGCAEGSTACDQYGDGSILCVDTLTDPHNCGGCAYVLDEYQEQFQCDYYTEACVNGTCQPLECPAGQTLCYGGCVDLNSDPYNCGACSSYCGGLVCKSGQCEDLTCDAPLVACDSQCIPPDPYNCGGCGSEFQCADGETCLVNEDNQASCAPLDCDAEAKVQCSSHSCSDLQTDESNCGECGNRCFFGTCVAGECTCASDQKACPDNGDVICTDLSADCWVRPL